MKRKKGVVEKRKKAKGSISKEAEKKIILDLNVLARAVASHKERGQIVVATIGSWDMIHRGHVRYIARAQAEGDILIVGADSDRAMKSYKGEERPIIPENERLEMLAYLSSVDYATLVDDVDSDGNWGYELLKVVKPHIYIAVDDSYPKEQLEEIAGYCEDRVIVLPRQADTSTTGTIEKAIKIRGAKVIAKLEEVLSEIREMVGVKQ